MAREQEGRAVRCGTSIKRLDALCRHFYPATQSNATAARLERMRVAFWRPPASLGASTVCSSYAFRHLPRGSTRQKGDEIPRYGEKFGLGSLQPLRVAIA